MNGNGVVNAADLTMLINVVFFGVPDIRDPLCPGNRSDFDCNGFTNAVDLTLMINHVFFGGRGPCDPCQCNPYPTNCPPFP